MKRILLWFSVSLFVALIATMLAQHQISISTANLSVKPSITFEPSVKPAVAELSEQDRIQLSAQFTQKIFKNYSDATMQLDCFPQRQGALNSKWGFMDTTGHLVIPTCFDWVESFSNGVAQVGIRKRPASSNTGYVGWSGYINREGVFVIPPALKYDQFVNRINNFSEDRLPLRRELKGKVGYIDRTGKFVIAPQFDEARPFSEELAGVCWHQEPVIKPPERRCGYIDLQGNLTTEPRFAYVRSFQNGLAVVQTSGDGRGQGERLGIIDKAGNYLVEPSLDFVDLLDRYSVASVESTKHHDASFYSGLLRVRIPDSELPPFPQDTSVPQDIFGPGKWGYVRKAGGYAIQPRFLNATNFMEERAIVEIDKSDVDYPREWRGKWAMIDKGGRIISTRNQGLEAILSNQTIGLIDGLAIAEASNKRYGFIDRNGKWAITPNFSQVRNFAEGLAAARDVKSGKWGYINRQGQWVIQPQFSFDSNYGAVREFSQGLAAVRETKSGKWGYVDRHGKFVIAPQFDPPSDFDQVGAFDNNGLAGVCINEKWGLINKQGHYLLEPKYSSISRFTNGIAQVQLSDKDPLVFVTKSGQFLPYTQQPQGALNFEISEGLIRVSGQLPNDF